MESKIAIIGLGYVGLPLAILCHQKGFDVLGIDIDDSKILALNKGHSYLSDLSDDEIKEVVQSPLFNYSNDYSLLRGVETIVICVPTPLINHSEPNLSFLKNTFHSMIPHLQKEQLIVVESSTYPGTTEEVLKPLIENAGWEIGDNLFLGYSPERIDPGNKKYSLENIPKVISGVTSQCLERLTEVYQKLFHELVPVKNTRIAEMTKIVENTQRFINISFMNELSQISHHLQVDIWDVIKAASTKPYGFTPYYPGPGIGGHCIPVDPLYLKWKADELKINTEFINLAKKINDNQPEYIVKRVLDIIGKKVGNVLVIGLSYKKDINDMRESAAIPVFQTLMERGVKVDYHDPFLKQIELNNQVYKHRILSAKMIADYDCVVILTEHTNIDYELIKQEAKIIFDTRNIYNENEPHIFKL
ncbi:UDP-N-acetyl-D-glucosamine dehydrogenase [Alkalihalobacillus alcalophilus ATCC 27647 = CGMCC 1.3604]|uniref:UDP-N-acetyl-D-glucosamine dehydrogenase n=1 Tax=Alkalihalobacillus alcalophilus ATCC 27647 = CGMCC 1.3604 TaxID=1218173 RepID=A0A094WHN7_ALKAL|nr:nucleotide sugar dehydrogenase [Alkalihalobacillus alcalophilus]KGA97299.1 UDP-N-acetyl-D-glucosamine dehydrogenase [Alkalihalobacillus alcalophilus ATCC 27647 = CGMCC 1.3604]MED1562525.1 nucleotide sugar dehydrogenase [Alkalihalobacillus alcalophilus]THG92136.1 UDP-N-acetyl-D-glucosamine dehydrogenase [Alkalihalobacillus alcalophilus ATCC 27647 = CGMCC 1.3604]